MPSQLQITPQLQLSPLATVPQVQFSHRQISQVHAGFAFDFRTGALRLKFEFFMFLFFKIYTTKVLLPHARRVI